MPVAALHVGAGGGGGAWVPSDVSGLSVWLDANDAGTFTFGTGSAVATWGDKSGNANHVTQATSGNRPTVQTAVLDSKDVVRFAQGSNQFLAKSSLTNGPGNAACTMAVVLKLTATISLEAVWDISDTTNTNRTLLFSNSGGNMQMKSQNGSPALEAFTDTTSFHVWSGTSTTTLRRLWRNGTQKTDSSATAQASVVGTNLRVGFLFQDVQSLNGDIAELVLYNTVLSTGDRQKLEGYLAHKWGLEGSLDGSHPYLASPP